MRFSNVVITLSILTQLFVFDIHAKEAIEFEDGQIVDQCKDYNRLRDILLVKDSIDNMIVQSAYLDCSLPSLVNSVDNAPFILDIILNKMLVRSLPTSLGQSVEDDSTLAVSGFKISSENNSVEYIKEDHNIVIVLKGKLSGNTYLVWVYDELLNSTYRAYFPAVVEVSMDDDIHVRPYYKSGY